MKIKAMRCLVCVLFKNRIVCKDDAFFSLRLQIVNIFVAECTGWLCQMGLIVVTIKHLVIVLQQSILIGWD